MVPVEWALLTKRIRLGATWDDTKMSFRGSHERLGLRTRL